MTRTIRTLAVLLSLSGIGCSLMMDDFQVSEDASVGADGDTDTDTDGDSDGDSDTDTDGDSDTDADGDADESVECGQTVTPPAGNEIEFCRVPQTSYFMGCDTENDDCRDDELPKHQVTLSAYLLQKYEVTVAEYREFLLANDDWVRVDGGSATSMCDSSYLQGWTGTTPTAGTLDRPVLGVCWHAAEAYCEWLGDGFRLPTEAEWETAARGGHDGEQDREYWNYPFEGSATCAKATYQGCNATTTDVGTRSGISFEAFLDMGGNAWEWVADWYQNNYYCDPSGEGLYLSPSCDDDFDWTDPEGPATGDNKVLRGGSWHHVMSMMRASKRDYLSPQNSSNLAGFRCAGDV